MFPIFRKGNIPKSNQNPSCSKSSKTAILVENSNSDSDTTSIDLNKTFLSTSENLDNLDSSRGSNLEMAKKDLNNIEALKFISTFDGTASKLHQFLECADIFYDDLKDTEHPKFLRLMKRLLIDKAYDETVKHTVYDDWDSLKEDLVYKFSEIRSKLEVSQELNTISQNQNEDVRSFASRVQTLLCKLNDICIYETGDGSEKIVKTLNAQTALVAFQEGLNKDIRIIVKSANCKNLKNSIEKAIEEEALSKRHIQSQTNSSVKCQFCRKNGHTADKCFSLRNTKNNNNKSSLKSNNSVIESQSTKPFSGNKNITCSYCKKLGHHIDNCYSRKNSEARKSKTDSSGSDNKTDSKKMNVVDIKDSGNLNRLEQSLSNRAVRARDL